MSNYITRFEAINNISSVIVKLNDLRSYNNQHISNKIREDNKILIEDVYHEINTRINNITFAHNEIAYSRAIGDLPPEKFVRYYGKICQLAKTLKLDSSETMNENIKLKELAEMEGKKRYYYYIHNYKHNHVIMELTESSVQLEHLMASVPGSNPSALRKEIRDTSTNLEELFEMDEEFMNEELRDFLNLNDNGGSYTYNELKTDGNWTESKSIQSAFHQTKVPTRYIMYKERLTHVMLLNTKFTNKDGREVIINSDEIVVENDLDKGTYNYVNSDDEAGHTAFDVLPWFALNGLSFIMRSYPSGTTTDNWDRIRKFYGMKSTKDAKIL